MGFIEVEVSYTDITPATCIIDPAVLVEGESPETLLNDIRKKMDQMKKGSQRFLDID
jgi:hypothetical protein